MFVQVLMEKKEEEGEEDGAEERMLISRDLYGSFLSFLHTHTIDVR